MVRTPSPSLMLALLGFDKFTEIVSLSSSLLSASIGTEIVCVVTLGAKVRVPEVDV